MILIKKLFYKKINLFGNKEDKNGIIDKIFLINTNSNKILLLIKEN